MRGSTDSTKKCAHLLVRKDKILNFIRFLVLNNPAYANIVINNERIENLVVGSEGYIVVREFDAPDEVGGRKCNFGALVFVNYPFCVSPSEMTNLLVNTKIHFLQNKKNYAL